MKASGKKMIDGTKGGILNENEKKQRLGNEVHGAKGTTE